MDNKVTDTLMIFIVAVVFLLLAAYTLFNSQTETAIEVVRGFLLIASNVATFFFTKHQVESKRE